MKQTLQAIVTLLVCAAWFASVYAQDDSPAEASVEEIRQYSVEIIIFSYEENVGLGTEIFVPDLPPAPAELLGAADAEFVENIAAAGPANLAEDDVKRPLQDLQLVFLPEEELTLDEIARKFELLDVYETIMHVGWVQATYPQEETPSIQLRLLGDPPEGLDGTFTLYLSRYLHLVVDLALDSPHGTNETGGIDQPYFSDDPAYSFGDSRSQHDTAFGRVTPPLRYRIQEDRIVKNGELRYFDHPKFGVLAKITRIETEDGDDEQLPEDLLSGTGQQRVEELPR